MKKRNEYTGENHTFVICAYKESQYLEECMISLKKQTIKSSIRLVTSTPCSYIEGLANKYEIPITVNNKGGEISKDWNFAIETADTELVTIAHQDDIYVETYLEEVLAGLNKVSRPLIAFSDYGEVRDGEYVTQNRLLKIKELMLLPLRFSWLYNSRFIRRRILSFGSPICCPSVTYVKNYLPSPLFMQGFRSDLDWQAWERFSRLKGGFVYCHKYLMYPRIHEESATTMIIGDNDRTREDFAMFCRFWPKPVAKRLERFYRSSEESNRL